MNVYEMITTKILAEMEQGTVPWHKSWIGVDAPIRWKDKKVYRGVNTLLLNKPDEFKLPKYTTDNRGTKFFTMSAVQELVKIKELMSTKYRGCMADFNAAYQWGKRGMKILESKMKKEEIRNE